MPLLTRDQVAKRAARELRDGMVVNLGIGMPTLVANFVPAGTDIVLQSENGLLGIGPFPYEGEEDPDLINAGKQTVTAVPGAAYFSSAESFAMIRGGPHRLRHPGRDAGGGDRRSRQLDDPRSEMIKGMGGAMDLVAAAKRVIVMMEHVAKGKAVPGSPPPVEEKKIVKRCTLPLTAVGAAVHRIITDLAVLDVTPAGLALRERCARGLRRGDSVQDRTPLARRGNRPGDRRRLAHGRARSQRRPQAVVPAARQEERQDARNLRRGSRSTRSTTKRSLSGRTPRLLSRRARSGAPGPVSPTRAASTPACTGGNPGRSRRVRRLRHRRRSRTAVLQVPTLASGQTGLSVAFDLPTQMGRDADHPLARGEAGRAGVSTSSVDRRHARTARGDCRSRPSSTSMTINATAATAALPLRRGGRRARHRATGKLSGTIQNDILKEYIARRHVHLPAGGVDAPVRRQASPGAPASCPAGTPRQHQRLSSAFARRVSDAVQEVAFTLADGVAYVEAARAAGLPVGDSFAPRLSFFFLAHAHLLEEVAKFQAARRLWARIMRARFDAKNPRSLMLRFHTQTAGSTLTAVDPLNNVARTTIEALAAGAAGGAPIDPHQRLRRGALALPTETSARVRAADAADPGARERRRRRGRSAGRRLRDRGADLGDRGTRRGAHRRDRPARRHGRGDRGRVPAARDRRAGPRPPARGRERHAL